MDRETIKKGAAELVYVTELSRKSYPSGPPFWGRAPAFRGPNAGKQRKKLSVRFSGEHIAVNELSLTQVWAQDLPAQPDSNAVSAKKHIADVMESKGLFRKYGHNRPFLTRATEERSTAQELYCELYWGTDNPLDLGKWCLFATREYRSSLLYTCIFVSPTTGRYYTTSILSQYGTPTYFKDNLHWYENKKLAMEGAIGRYLDSRTLFETTFCDPSVNTKHELPPLDACKDLKYAVASRVCLAKYCLRRCTFAQLNNFLSQFRGVYPYSSAKGNQGNVSCVEDHEN